MAALPQLIFDKTAQLCLDDLELLMDVSSKLEDIGARLATFELALAEADQIDDPIVAIHGRLDQLSSRLTALDAKQRRPVTVQLYTNDPPAEKRPAIDLRETLDARDRMAIAMRKLDAELRELTARFDRQASLLDHLCGVNITARVDCLVNDRVSERDVFSALNGRMSVLEAKLLEVEQKVNDRLDRCATVFSRMRDQLTALAAMLGVAVKLGLVEKKRNG